MGLATNRLVGLCWLVAGWTSAALAATCKGFIGLASLNRLGSGPVDYAALVSAVLAADSLDVADAATN